MKLLLTAATSFSIALLWAHIVTASSGVVITQVQTGAVSSVTHEVVEIYNNTDTDIDVTEWCLRYTSAVSISLSGPKYCFESPDDLTKLYLGGRSHALIVTSGYTLPSTMVADGIFTSDGLSAQGGHIKLYDGEGYVVDAVGWGTAIYGEGYSLATPAPLPPSNTQTLARIISSTDPLLIYQDTDSNYHDLERADIGTFRSGGVYELEISVDVCPNIELIQEALPDGHGLDESKNCVPFELDICSNITDVQIVHPEGFLSDENGGCYQDVCVNITGLQNDVPAGFSVEDNGCNKLEDRALLISEILANAAGLDAEKEFVELYNPNDTVINLEGYQLAIGKNQEKMVTLPPLLMSPGGYVIFSDTDLKITLLNTENHLELIAPAGNTVSEAHYITAPEDQSWAIVDGVWQYTDRLTPGEPNIASSSLLPSQEEVDIVANYVACPSGKYRHPITNRCRNIESDTKMLVACEEDEYRNPETNRCRKAAVLAASLTACRVGYERNNTTNRCRKIAVVSTDLSPCRDGYERNPATNRCKKAAGQTAATLATAPPIETKPADNAIARNTLVAAAGVAAGGYGIYEWRTELGRAARRVLRRFP